LRIVFALILFNYLLFAQSVDSSIKEAIVKIYSSAKEPNYKKPWVSTTSRSSGSGAIIQNNLILTNAHVVANATFLEVQKYNQAKRYIAKVVAVSHELDLALISTEDESFFKGIKPLSIGNLPYSEDKIAVFGYPMGGKTISVTSGVVSRIEHQRYVHSAQKLLAIQVDAAINPGNSGGPAISSKGKIVGVVMQGISFSQNIGYLVPSTMIKHFLQDVKDGKLDGVPQLHIFISKLENPATKRYYGLKPTQTGVLVTKVMPLGNSANVLKKGDIILEIDGKKVQDDGTIEFRENEYTSAKYAVDLHQMGDSVKLKIFRDKKVITLQEKLTKDTNSAWLVKLFEYDKDPRYLIYGGYVFSPLVENMIETGSKKQCRIYSKLDISATKDKKEQVVLLGVLADRSNRGNQDKYNFLVDKINGKKILDFNMFYKEILGKKDGFIVLENDSEQQLIIDVKEAKARHKAILNIYNIQFDRSKDLREKSSNNSI
jgi:S1-C subfamily serine protease